MPISELPTGEERAACEREVRQVLEAQVKPHLRPKLAEVGPVQLVGTGGTSTILARVELKLRSFSREMIEGTLLSREQVKSETLRLWSTPLEERKKIIGLPPNRADVILTGAAIFSQVMEVFALEALRVSTRGLRFAALMD
jgi:exopolyphosphatase/guanosine-5'-triphosphate,3'-diphosphate pyrophosphatase